MTVSSRTDDGGTVLEFLSDYVKRLEDVRGLFAGRDIVTSTDVQDAASALVEDLDISKMPILWSLMDYKMFYLVTVPANTVVPAHRHDESIFRLIVEGELHINDRLIRSGEWVVVGEGVEYEIRTSTGYHALSAYTSNCRTRRGVMTDITRGGVEPQGL